MIDDLAKKRVEKLTNKAFEHLQAKRYRETIQAAMELEDAKEGVLAYYLAGEAYAGMNQIKDAIAVMRRGVLKRPTFWCNWFFLGIYLGRLDKFQEALAAHNQALLCPGVDADQVRLNLAITSIDAREYGSALSYLDGVNNPAMKWGVDGSRVLALEGVGRIAEAAESAEQFLKERPEADEDYDKRVGFIAAALARIRLRQGSSPEEIRRFLFHCLEEYGCSKAVLREITKLKGLRYSKESKNCSLVIHAKLPVGHSWYREAPGYVVAYNLIADSEQRALEMINEYESAAGVESIEVMDFRTKEETPEEPMGVYWISERFFS